MQPNEMSNIIFWLLKCKKITGFLRKKKRNIYEQLNFIVINNHNDEQMVLPLAVLPGSSTSSD